MVGDNDSTNYFCVDWFTPDGLGTWGGGRMFILGTKDYIELRKYTNVSTDNYSDNVIVVTNQSEQLVNVEGKVGYPFFGELILDSLNGTEKAMTQEHCFKAAKHYIQAQMQAVKIK